jgi:hypothetical protein
VEQQIEAGQRQRIFPPIRIEEDTAQGTAVRYERDPRNPPGY